MKITITIDCANAAFGDTSFDAGIEVSRILREQVATTAERGGLDDLSGLRLRDANGNTCGNVDILDSK